MVRATGGRLVEHFGGAWHYTELQPTGKGLFECDLCDRDAEFLAVYRIDGEPETGSSDAICSYCLEEGVGFIAFALWKKRSGL